MIYHVGALNRLNELGFLPRLAKIARVSGGSITAGVLALAWHGLTFNSENMATIFNSSVAEPVLTFAGIQIDIKAILFGLLPGCSAANCLARSYDRHLFHRASLQDILDETRSTRMATNLQTGSGWRFSKAYTADHRVGLIDQPTLPFSCVGAASSAVPPVLSPARLALLIRSCGRRRGLTSITNLTPRSRFCQMAACMTILALNVCGNVVGPYLSATPVVRSQKSGNPADAGSVRCFGH